MPSSARSLAACFGASVEVEHLEGSLSVGLSMLRIETGRLAPRAIGGGSPVYAGCRSLMDGSGTKSFEPLCVACMDHSRPCWSHDRSVRSCGWKNTGRDHGDCFECPVLTVFDSALLRRLPAVVVMFSSDETVLYSARRIIRDRVGYTLVPMREGARAAELVGMISPDLVIVDEHLEDTDPAALEAGIARTGGVPDPTVLRISRGSGPGQIDLPLTEGNLIPAINMALLNSRSWTERNRFRPVVLLWAARSDMEEMIGNLVIDAGAIPVSSPGAFDMLALAARIDPDCLVVQGDYTTADVASLTGMLTSDSGASPTPLLLIGGDRDWLGGAERATWVPGDAAAAAIARSLSGILAGDEAGEESAQQLLLGVPGGRPERLVRASIADRFGSCGRSWLPDTGSQTSGPLPVRLYGRSVLLGLASGDRAVTLRRHRSDGTEEELMRIDAAPLHLPGLWRALRGALAGPEPASGQSS